MTVSSSPGTPSPSQNSCSQKLTSTAALVGLNIPIVFPCYFPESEVRKHAAPSVFSRVCSPTPSFLWRGGQEQGGALLSAALGELDFSLCVCVVRPPPPPLLPACCKGACS